MILSWFRKTTDSDAVYAVYRAIVAQSRQPVFYAQWGVPDTVTGRFDMIGLHMALLFRRLRAGNAAGREFAQAVFDLFFKDMDRSLREMGAGDLGVPKRIQKMGNVFFGLLAALNQALDSKDDEALAQVLARNVFSDGAPEGVGALVAYVGARDAELARMSIEAIMQGQLRFSEAA